VISKHPKSKRSCPTPSKRKKKRSRVTPVPQSVPGIGAIKVGESTCRCTGSDEGHSDGVMTTDGCLNLNSPVGAPSWNERAFCMLKSLSSQVIGFGGSHKQCPSCLVVASSGSDLKHRDGCLLQLLLKDYATVVRDHENVVLDTDSSFDTDTSGVTSDDDENLDFYLDGSDLLNYEIDLAE